ncbi:MAG: glycosyltransferase [candidate division KSB1 bacterium]
MNKKIKILQIGPYPPPGTGWSIRIKMLKKYIERAGHACVVMNTNKNRKVASGEFVPVLGAGDYCKKVVRYCAQGYLVHMHLNGKSTKSPILALIAETVSLLFGRRAVLTFHAGVKQDFFPKQNKFWLDSTFRLIFLLAKKIVCNNEEVKALIAAYGIKPEKIIPIPAFCLEYLEDQAELPRTLADFIRNHHPALCSYIYVRHDFNLDFVFAAMQRVLAHWPRLGIVWMGADRESQVLQQKLREHGLEQCSYIAGDLDHGDFLAVLEASAAYVRTPVVDGVSSSVLEALMLGATVVASENGSRPEGVLTYEDGNIASFAETLLQISLSKNGKPALDKTALARKWNVRDTLREEIDLLCRVAK